VPKDEFTINIDMDKKCSRCGHKGALDSGICMRCATKRFAAKAKPVPGEYEQSERVEEIAKELITLHHPHLQTARIAYLMKQADPDKPPVIKRQGKHAKAGLARTVPALYYCLTGFDFIIEIREGWWDMLTLDQQTALVDHELCHCQRDDDGWYLVDHDVEEFRAILSRYGFWKDGLEQFVEAAQKPLPFESRPTRAEKRVH
jgi:hypothetical protein